MSRKVDGALLASLFSLALAVRLVPLLLSTLPYNIDGFALARIAQEFGATGRWTLNPADPNIDDLKLPAFSLLWAAQAQLGGLDPLTDLQWFLPILTSTVTLPAYLLGVKLTDSRRVAFAAGAFLALFGSFLFLTSAVMKESLALVLLPTIVLTFYERADPRKRGIATVLLLVMVFLHHVTLLMAVGAVGALILLEHGRALSLGRFAPRGLALDVATGLGPFAAGMAYYAVVNLGTVPTAADDLILFAAVIVVLAALLARAWRPAPARRGRRGTLAQARVLLVPAFVIGGILVNAHTAVFAGTVETTPAFLSLLPAVGVLAAFALLGYLLMRRTANRANDVVLALAVGPVALALFGFLRGLDAFSLRVVYRSFDFLDFALALLAGIGIAALWFRLGPHRGAKAALVAVFLGALLATSPMAWSTQATFGVDNVTTPSEFQAISFAASLNATALASDQRLTTVGTWWFGLAQDRTLPYAIADGESVTGPGYAIVLDRWTTAGAQEFPGANVVVSASAMQDFLAANRVVYVAGPPGDHVYVVQLIA